MAYAAVASLVYTIAHLLDSPRTSVAVSAEKNLESARCAAERIRQTLQENDKIKNSSERVKDVEARIKEEACKLEDAIEFEASAQFLYQHGHGRISPDLHHLEHDINSFVEALEKLEAEYVEELHNHEEEAAAVSSSTDCGVTRNEDDEMVGLSDLFLQLRDILSKDHTSNLKSFIIYGMAGIGKTKLATKLFNDPLINEKFKRRAFVTVGRKYDYQRILLAILAQLNHDSDGTVMMEHETVVDYFQRCLEDMKFLIVLDDVWDVNDENRFRNIVPENSNGSFVVVTGRAQINTFFSCKDSYRVRFLGVEESWELLQREVFGEDDDCCLPLLVEAGKKIAKTCEGLPLLIITVARILAESPNKEPEYWEAVAEMKNSVIDDACDQLYELLLPSYHYLKQDSKACFLYMGVYPKSYVIRCSRILNLWRAERFADNLENIFHDIVRCSLSVTRELCIYRGTKTCNIHVAYRRVIRRVAQDIKFLHILNTYDAEEPGWSTEEERGLQGMRHLAIYFNTLLAMKEVHNSISSVSNLRSVLCTGPYHQYQVPVCLELKLLRVLDTMTIRFYEFPIEVVKLIRLRYLSLTTNANLPPSISKLWFLEYLIVYQHLSIMNQSRVADESYAPVEIWELQELQHLEIVGRNLPPPPPGATLPNLLTLIDVGVQTCSKEVLERIPQLKKLRFRIENAPDEAQSTESSCFDHISSSLVTSLDSLTSVVVNPTFSTNPKVPPSLLSVTNMWIHKLTLSGLGYAWEDIAAITRIPCLLKLKLQSYACRGQKWETTAGFTIFYLFIEDSDLVHWTATDENFPMLCDVTMKNCYRLREIPLSTAYRSIKLVDCHPEAEIYAMKTQNCTVEATYSWK